MIESREQPIVDAVRQRQSGKFAGERRMPGCIKRFGKVKRDDVKMDWQDILMILNILLVLYNYIDILAGLDILVGWNAHGVSGYPSGFGPAGIP